MESIERRLFGHQFVIEADGYRVLCRRGGRHRVTVPQGWAALDVYLGTVEGQYYIPDNATAPKLTPARTFSFLPPNETYTIDFIRAGNTVVFLFQPEAIHIPPAREILANVKAPVWHESDSAMISVGEIVHGFMTAVQHQVDPRETRFIRDLFSVRLLQVLSSASAAHVPQTPVQRAIEFIEHRFRDAVPYSEIASAAGLSGYSLARHFRNKTGISIRHYIIRRRVQYAINLIANTEKSLAEIAFESGFSSQSHMSTAFRKHTGRTPKSHRLVELRQSSNSRK